MLAGGPWEAYGPIHSLFAPMMLLSPLLPKVTFSVMALWVGWLLLKRGLASRVQRSFAMVLIFFVLNPLVVVSTYVYGQNDIVVALLLAFALGARADAGPPFRRPRVTR